MSNEVELFVGTVATNIRRLRQQAGLTLADLAAEAGLGKSTLAQLESGRGNPSVETLWAIAAALRVPFGRLVEEEGPALRVVRASEQPVVRSAETAQVGRLLTASHRRGTFELYAMDIGPEPRNADPHHAGGHPEDGVVPVAEVEAERPVHGQVGRLGQLDRVLAALPAAARAAAEVTPHE